MARRPGSRRTRQASSSWPDLPSELLGVVLLRLSLADRVHLSAVCRSWRSGARLQPLPAPPPWLILRNDDFLDLADNAVRRMPVPDGALCRGSVDDWLVLMSERSHRWYLMNPFSGATLPAPEITAFWREAYAPVRQGYLGPPSKLYVKKVAVSWEHDDDGSSRRRSPVLAAVVHDRLTHFEIFKVFVCWPGAGSSPSSSMEFKRGGDGNVFRDAVQDVAFFKGELYVVHHDGELRAFELREGRGGRPEITGVKHVAHGPGLSPSPNPHPAQGCTMKPLYLVPSGDRLLMVSIRSQSGHRTVKFDVFEAQFGGGDAGSRCRWEKADSLHGRELFVGTHCSGSVPANLAAGTGAGVREDCIYYVEGATADCGVYDMRDGSCSELGMTMGGSGGLTGNRDAAVAYGVGGSWFPTWLFPAGAGNM
ncbi:hypothetical protein ACP70R_041855 [Stipagrostis hirtigluma subsp. patula]